MPGNDSDFGNAGTWRGIWLLLAGRLHFSPIRRISFAMDGFIYFNITDHARLPARFFGMTRTILARL
ncbi:hypothetical protein D2N39_07305 [Gemmobacter lutimaris]|uniref:Uncharacterized protein n=1 Tax=Gemmobacter lutimaris TaxID=2306023 RepID=A0A398BPH3_9RHOB|nr:hypothetical protein [Gemmobacter lutimaris]RID92445.1 hypothetical protein D2N39_07305 [Gemmobacter lutimaris]